MDIPIDRIKPNPKQPRLNIDQADLESLAQSICENGLIQPIVVEITDEGDYILHDGERRWRAAQIAGLEEIPAHVVASDDVSDRDRLTRAVVANVQRADLTPLEVARAYQELHDLGLTDGQIADKVGKSRSSVANARRLLELPEEAQNLASQEGVSERTLTALLPIYKNLPQDIIDQAETTGYGWQKPSTLLGEIKLGKANSDYVRRQAASIIKNNTVDLDRAIWPLDHSFDADGLKVEALSCDNCPLLITLGKNDEKEYRCPRSACFEAKEARWIADKLASISEELGIPIVEGDLSYGEKEDFYSDPDLLEKIMEHGCDNLRLRFNHCADDQYKIICHHGRGKSCECLRKLRAERTRNDPGRVAERERQKKIQSIVDNHAQALAEAIDDGNVHVWRQLLRYLDPYGSGKSKKSDEWDLDLIRRKMAERIIRNSLDWQSEKDPDLALNCITETFRRLDVALPQPDDPLEALAYQLERIGGWMAGLADDLPTWEAVAGNRENLEKLSQELTQLEHDETISPADADPLLREVADAWDILDALHRLMLNPLFEIEDFNRIIWLHAAPIGDLDFEGLLETATVWEIQYVLALVDGQDEREQLLRAHLQQIAPTAEVLARQQE